MTSRIERPVFYEGQILGAEDLSSAVDHANGQQARHERSLHLWGITHGLILEGKDKEKEGVAYKEITLGEGMAIDGSGREIVVPESERLSEDQFDQNVAKSNTKDDWYPVLLKGRDELIQPISLSLMCGNQQSSRSEEGYDIVFASPGYELALENQRTPAVADGPGDGAWELLLGFVQWNETLKQFVGVKSEHNGAGRRYAGVLADKVAARDGRLMFSSRPENESGKPVVVMDEKSGLNFGLLSGQNDITSLFSVNLQGDVAALGKITGALTTGSIQAESGIATDGVMLPLPPGITEKQVADGDAVVHTQISILIREEEAPSSPAGSTWGAFPLEALVDRERRLRCRIRWFRLDSPAGSVEIEDRPGACSFIVLASVRPKKESAA